MALIDDDLPATFTRGESQELLLRIIALALAELLRATPGARRDRVLSLLEQWRARRGPR